MASINQTLNLFLTALQYPKRDEFTLDQPQQIQSLVNWLENVKIRHYPIEDRQQLKSTDRLEWDAAMLGLDYADDVERCTEVADKLLADTPSIDDWVPPPLPPFDDIHSEETKTRVEELRKILNLDPHPEMTIEESLGEILEVTERKLVPALELMKDYEGGPKPTVTDLLSKFSLGFSTGDPAVDQAATILRALFVQDLRNLQTQIDDAIEEAQAKTANPRTTASGPAAVPGEKRKATS